MTLSTTATVLVRRLDKLASACLFVAFNTGAFELRYFGVVFLLANHAGVQGLLQCMQFLGIGRLSTGKPAKAQDHEPAENHSSQFLHVLV